ncbi:ATP-dependent DNA ligase [Paenibacillus cremeus]|uniref:ATP-dependent DNA ligase n=2 Tax=Paenibacillus cremeus TaxID=2163881 RepID=A0A559K425_9BACL|nr:ATP-dependent DNA ligase [Paenibacillus cremeus]
MLLHKSATPPAGDYIHHLKYDGFRCLLHVGSGGKTKLYTRQQNDCTLNFPEFAGVGLPAGTILDGEMVALGDDGKPIFEDVMNRLKSRRGQHRQPVHFAAFDLLMLGGKSIMHEPLETRLAALLELLAEPTELLSAVQSAEDGEGLFEAVKRLGLEGIVSKKKGSRYTLDHRSPDWIKVKNYQYAVVSIAGIRKSEFAWLLQNTDGSYAGICELVPPKERAAFYQVAQQLIRSEDKHWLYLDPRIQCQVKFQCYTKGGLLRTPSFVEFIFPKSA